MVEGQSIRKIIKNMDTEYKGGGLSLQCHSGAKTTQESSLGTYSVQCLIHY